MNKYKIGLVCMIALGSLAMSTADVNANDNNGINSSQVRSGEFDPTTSEYYNAPVSDEEFQEKWEAASIKGDNRTQTQPRGGVEWYVDGDDLHLGEITWKPTNLMNNEWMPFYNEVLTKLDGVEIKKMNIFIDKVNYARPALFKNFQSVSLYGLNNIEYNKSYGTEELFSNSINFKTDFRLLDVSEYSNFEKMFYNSKVTELDVSKWDTGNVTNMCRMFQYSQVTELDISNWNTSKVTDMSFLFYSSSVTELDVSKWDTSKVTDMGNMFSGIPVTKLDVSGLDTSNVIYMNSMFSGLKLINLDLSNLNTGKVTDMGSMFNSTSITNLDVSNLNTGNVTDMSAMFGGSSITNLDVSNWDTGNVTTMKSMFVRSSIPKLDVSKWDTGKVRDMSYMFENSNKLDKLDVSNWDTGSVTNTLYMFNASSITSLGETNVSKWNTGRVTNMYGMFVNSKISELDVSNWNTERVRDMSFLFDGSPVTELDVSKWDTGRVTDMRGMFRGVPVTKLDVSGWDTSNVIYMQVMFTNSPVTELEVSNWNTSRVTSMYQMFSGSQVINLDISNWDTSKVTDMGSMFININNIETLKLGGFNKNAPISNEPSPSYNYRLALSSTNKVKNIDFTGFNFDETHLKSISTPNIQTMTINETIYQPERKSSPFNLDNFPVHWRLASDHSITATSDELHTSTVVRDHPGLWEVYTLNHLSLSTSTPNIAFNDVKLGSLNSKVVKLGLDYDSADGVVLSQKANRDDNQFSLKRNSDNYNLSTTNRDVYTSTENKAVEELEYELEFNPTKLGAADNSITWTLSYKI